MILGLNEVCPPGKEITTLTRCIEVDHWAKELNLTPVREVYHGFYDKWKSVPFQCSAQVGWDDTIHFCENDQTDNKRFASGEFVMICEKGL